MASPSVFVSALSYFFFFPIDWSVAGSSRARDEARDRASAMSHSSKEIAMQSLQDRVQNLVAALLGLGIGCSAPAAKAESINFGSSLEGSGWETVQFALLSRASFQPNGASVRIRTEGNGALIWKPLPEAFSEARRAAWTWSADQAVPATDLTRKGSDDRVISVYFLFGSAADVGKSATRLLRSDTTRAVVYTFGSDVPRGTVLPSPHMGARGKFIMLRSVSAANGKAMTEKVDLAKDFQRLFSQKPDRLLGVAISSDSDDTGAINAATIGQISVSQ
jgi:hypothetical protein